jgi:fermentation-respiration switch protein FrsA (DUF1100 family)
MRSDRSVAGARGTVPPRLARRRGVAVLSGAAALLATGCQLDSRFLYHPQPHGEPAWREIARRAGAEPLEVAHGAQRLRGWLLRPPGAPSGARLSTVLYFGGNAEEVSWMLGERHRLGGAALAAFNYRGYGASTGTPHESALSADGVALLDHLTMRSDVDAARIVLWGRSLGTGVAVQVASRRAVAALMLTSPYDSIAALARHHLPWLAFLLAQPFDALSLAPSIRAPMLALVAGRDTVVPPAHSERLVAAWGGPARTVRFPSAGHNDIQAAPGYWEAARGFLAGATA